MASLLVAQLGTSPLHLAAQYGHYSTTEVLLRAGVSRDARTKVDRTPLHMAASEGHASIVEVLLKVCGFFLPLTFASKCSTVISCFVLRRMKLILIGFICGFSCSFMSINLTNEN